jgi:hypothetical protein
VSTMTCVACVGVGLCLPPSVQMNFLFPSFSTNEGEITRTPLRCGGDECDADSLSLLIHTYIHRHTSMYDCLFAFLSILDSWWPNSDSLSLLIQSYIPTCILGCVCMYIHVLVLYVFPSIPYSWWSNSLFFLDLGRLICRKTSCRSFHPAFLPGFHRFSECVCFSWLSTEILCLSESVDFLSLLDMFLPVFLVLLVFVCLCHGVHRQTNRHNREIKEIVQAHTRVRTRAEVTRTRLSCGGGECDADLLSLLIHTYIHRHTS